jgi:hypothetical protein
MARQVASRSPSALDGLAMRTTAKRKLAASANTHDLFHRLCLMHRLNRRCSGRWEAPPALASMRRAR